MTSPALPIGVSYGVYKGRVDADAAIAYALATNDPNEMCVRGQAVPPLFTVSFLLDAVHEAVQATSTSGGIHGALELARHQPGGARRGPSRCGGPTGPDVVGGPLSVLAARGAPPLENLCGRHSRI